MVHRSNVTLSLNHELYLQVKPLLPKKISLEVEDFLQRRLAELTQTADGSQPITPAEQVEDYRELRAEYVRRLIDSEKKKWLEKAKAFQDLWDLGGELVQALGPKWTINQFYEEVVPKIREKWKGDADALPVFILYIEDRKALTELEHRLEAARQGGRRSA